MRRRIENIVLSWDTIVGVLVGIVGLICIQQPVPKDVQIASYGTGIAVLSIIFSLFFASLAVIMALPDNKFIVFIESGQKLFTALLGYFRATLWGLFVSLIYTIVVYFLVSLDAVEVNRYFFILFLSTFFYSLSSTMIAVTVTISITGSRATFLSKSEEKEDAE